ncbi:MAG: efflux RND transporter periplasmic adaptor subunit [Nitrospira sp.]|nr:MAG: efflux RND transporter periplasmic adaptor subunit [Nitrospira sp.]
MSSRVKMMLMLIGAATLAVALAWIIAAVKGAAPNATSSELEQKVPRSDAKALPPWPVQVLKPQRRDITFTITLPANVSPWRQATLYAKVPGYLKWMGFDKGDAVKQGQLLAVIDAPEVDQQYRQAEADFKIKQLTYQRLVNVWKENPDVIAKQDVDVAEAEADAAKHATERYRILQDYTKVPAPFSGVITARFADPGTLIQAATGSVTQTVPLYTLMDLDTVRVYASVPQEVALLAKPGVSSVLTVREMPGKSFKGSIARTTEALDPATRTLLIEIDMPNTERQLQPGMFVNATLSLRQHPNALVIPPVAIVNSGSDKGKSVFVVEEGKARRVPIKTDIDDGVWVEVTEGLSDQHDVVVVGKTGLSEGQVVKVSEYNLPAGKPSSQRY